MRAYQDIHDQLVVVEEGEELVIQQLPQVVNLERNDIVANNVTTPLSLHAVKTL
jgi:hypothetical protein